MTVAVVARRAQSGPAAGTRLPFATGGTLFHLSGLHSAPHPKLHRRHPLRRPYRIRLLVGHSGDHFLHSLQPAA